MPNKYALLIGITYPNSDAALPGCDNDIYEIYKFLKVRGFDEFDILTDTNIFDEFNLTLNNPSVKNIIHSFFTLAAWARNNPDGLIFLHYSGHGSQVADTNWLFDVANRRWSREELDGKDECMVTQDLHFITDDQFNWLFRQLPPTIKLFSLMDSCHSGSAFDLKYYLKNPNESAHITSQHDINANVIMISGCKDEQYGESHLFSNKWYGVMSYSFLYLMKYMNNYNINQVSVSSLWYNMGIVCSNFPQIPQSSSSKNNFTTTMIKCTNDTFDIIDTTPSRSNFTRTVNRSIINNSSNLNKRTYNKRNMNIKNNRWKLNFPKQTHLIN